MRATLLACWLVGCHAMAPPPLTLRHQGPDPDPVGHVQVQLAFGLGAGILGVDDGVGWAVKLRWQATEAMQAGVDLGRGYNLNHRDEKDANRGRHPHRVNWMRLAGRYHPVEALAVEAGAGGGFTDLGMSYLTLDTGAVTGARFELPGDAGFAGPYAGPIVALSVPVTQGPPIRRPKHFLGGGPARPPRRCIPRT